MKQFLLFSFLSIFSFSNINTQIIWQKTVGGSDDEYTPYSFEKDGGGYVFTSN